MRRAAIWFAVIVALAPLACPATYAQGKTSGLPLPRFVSLRSNEVSLRAGPGIQYPSEWLYRRQGLPVEVIAEYTTWRKVRDWQGTQGWMHQSMLGGERTAIVLGETRTLRARADSKSDPVARLEAGVIAKLLECPDAAGWCRVEADGHRGWLRRVEFWGAYPEEVVR